MKRRWYIVGLVAIVLLIGFVYVHEMTSKTTGAPVSTACGAEMAPQDGTQPKHTIEACSTKCNADFECKSFVGSCISAYERPYYQERLSVAYEAVSCSCVEHQCVGTKTGEMMI